MKSDFAKQVWAERNGFKFIELYDEDLENLNIEYFKEKFEIDL